MGIHSRARPTIASLLVSYGNGYENKILVFFCKHFIGRLRNSPLRTEYNDLHDQEDYRMTFFRSCFGMALSMAVEAF